MSPSLPLAVPPETLPMGLQAFLGQADGVILGTLLLLSLASVATWALIATQWWRARAQARRSQAFLARWQAEAEPAGDPTEPFAVVAQHAQRAARQSRELLARQGEKVCLTHPAAQDVLSRSLRRALDELRARHDASQTVLATVASSAPFVGLFGTVWGIYHALAAIGVSGQTTLDKVAGPVGESLIMTAVGLAVAIPASVAYNAFARRHRREASALQGFAHEQLTELLLRDEPLARADVRLHAAR